MKVSIVLNTCYDMYPITGLKTDVFNYLLKGLKLQTFKDFELVIIDREYDSRKDFIKSLDIPFPYRYCPPKPNRYAGLGNLVNISSDRNSGVILSSGDMIICLTDCVTLMDDKLLEQIVSYYDNGILLRPITRPYSYKIDKDNPVVSLDPVEKWMNTQEDKSLYEVSGNCTYCYLFPASVYEQVNGFDERCDLSYGSEDCIFNNIVDAIGIKRYIIKDQYHFARASHQHSYNIDEFSVKDKKSLLTCKEAYPHWMYRQISSRRILASNNVMLTDSDISEMESYCKNCTLQCNHVGTIGAEYYRTIQPVFDIRLLRKAILSAFGHKYGVFDPWK